MAVRRRIGWGPWKAPKRSISSRRERRQAVWTSTPWMSAWVWKLRREPVASTKGRPMRAQPAMLAERASVRAMDLV